MKAKLFATKVHSAGQADVWVYDIAGSVGVFLTGEEHG